MALQFAKMIGARVIQTSGSAEKRTRWLDLGADEVIDYIAEPDWHKSVLRLTGGEGADMIVDVGDPGTLSHLTGAVKVGGAVVSVGFAADEPSPDSMTLMGRAIKVIGNTVESCDMFREMARATEAYDLLRQGRPIGKIALAVPGDDFQATPGAL